MTRTVAKMPVFVTVEDSTSPKHEKKVTEDGTYDLLLNPGAAVAKVVKSGDNPGI